MFIECIDKDGDTIFINMNHVVGIEPKPGAFILLSLSNGTTATVQGDIDSIRARLKELREDAVNFLKYETK